MTALVVFTHPKPDQFASELLDATVDGLIAAGHEVSVLDLYRENFEAAMSRDEWRAYPTPHPVLGDERYADLVRKASVIAFVFPRWWSGPPSMLKGFFDRGLASRAHHRRRHRGRTTGALSAAVDPTLGARFRQVAQAGHGMAHTHARVLGRAGRGRDRR